MDPNKEIVFFSKEYRSLSETASFLRTIADRLDQDGFIALSKGDQKTEIKPAASLELEIKYKVKGEKKQLEIELEWRSDEEPVSVE